MHLSGLWGYELNLTGSGKAPAVSSCERGNVPSGSIGAELFNQLNDYELLKKNFAPWS
jgi:hypothetical protein